MTNLNTKFRAKAVPKVLFSLHFVMSGLTGTVVVRHTFHVLFTIDISSSHEQKSYKSLIIRLFLINNFSTNQRKKQKMGLSGDEGSKCQV